MITHYSRKTQIREAMVAEGEIHQRRDEEDREEEEANLAAEMERMIAIQEETGYDDNVPAGERQNNDAPMLQPDDDVGMGHARPLMIPNARSYIKLYYTSLSFTIATLHIIYILRTRKQVYLALLYLTSSKISYIALRNAILAFFLFAFNLIIQKFLNGLRLMESETIVENMRWNVTETCLALTMFRQELSIGMVGMFLILILSKSLHWAVELRGSHLRMTEEAFYYINDGDQHGGGNPYRSESTWWVWKGIGIFLPEWIKTYIYAAYVTIPRVRSSHLKFCVLVSLLQLADLCALTYCATHLLESGPSAHILFGFEAAILVASIISIQALYGIHVFDGVITFMQRVVLDKLDDDFDDDSTQQNTDDGAALRGEVQPPLPENSEMKESIILSKLKAATQNIAFFWRDHRATATFAVELMAVAAMFLFNLLLFVVVFTIYGLPINIVRDLYMAYTKLRSRLSAFASYRRLTSNMNTRFKSITTEEELDQTGRTCIICRDTMDIHGVNGDCKMLPICQHGFHKHCLREWLVQQQSCPTCRADIQKNEDKARAEEKRQEVQARLEEINTRESIAVPPEDASPRTDHMQASVPEPANLSEAADEKSEELAFPCLYKVASLRGAPVFTFFNPDGTAVDNSPHTHQKVLRVIKMGTFVACTEIKWQSWYKVEENGLNLSGAGAGMFLKIPDGWVQEYDLERYLSLVSPSKTTTTVMKPSNP